MDKPGITKSPEQKPTKKRTKRLLAIVVSILVLYVLSSGPVLYLMRREFLPESFVKRAYMPMAFLEELRPVLLYQRWWYYTPEERSVIVAEETWTAAQWLSHAMEQLRKRGAPPSALVQSPEQKYWADSGYLLFFDGWAAFESHSSHDSQRIGDIGLLLTSDGIFYTNDFHYCMGESEFRGRTQPQPKNLAEFLERYGTEQKWKRQP